MEDLGRTAFDEEDAPSPLLVKKQSREAEPGSLCTIKIAREATRLSNQRGEPRRPAPDEQVTIRFRNQTRQVGLVNVSSSGAMIESDIQPAIGEALQIRFGEAESFSAITRWVAAGRVGLEFGAPSILLGSSRSQDFVFGLSEADGPADDQAEAPEPPAQREPRQAVIRTAMIKAGVKKVAVRLCNISSHGVMLESDHCLAPGAAVQLEMAGGIIVSGEVRWSKGKRAGLSFDEAINTQGLSSMKLPMGKSLKPAYLGSEFDPQSPWAARFERLTISELSKDPTPVSDDEVPASWRRPAQSGENGG